MVTLKLLMNCVHWCFCFPFFSIPFTLFSSFLQTIDYLNSKNLPFFWIKSFCTKQFFHFFTCSIFQFLPFFLQNFSTIGVARFLCLLHMTSRWGLYLQRSQTFDISQCTISSRVKQKFHTCKITSRSCHVECSLTIDILHIDDFGTSTSKEEETPTIVKCASLAVTEKIQDQDTLQSNMSCHSHSRHAPLPFRSATTWKSHSSQSNKPTIVVFLCEKKWYEYTSWGITLIH